MTMRRIYVFAIILTLLLGACSCTSFSNDSSIKVYEDIDNKVYISISYNWTGLDSKAPYWEARLMEFQELYHDEVVIELIPVVGGGSGIRTKIQTDFASNSAADVMIFYDGKEILPYVERGYIADLTDILESNPNLKNRFIEGTMDTATFNDRVYALPMAQAVLILYANQRIFDKYELEYPETYDDMLSVIKIFNENGIVPIALGNKYHEKSILVFSAISQRILQPDLFEKASYSLDGVNFLDDEFIRVAEVIMELSEIGAFPKNVNNVEKFEAISMFSNEEAAMLFEGSWVIGSIDETLVPYVDPILIPVFPETQAANGLCGFAEMDLMVNANAMKEPEKKEYIVKLIEFVTEPKFVKEFAEGSGSLIPSVNGVELNYNETNPLLFEATKLFNNADQRGPRLFSYLSPGQMIALREGVSNMLINEGTAYENLRLLWEKTKEENNK